MSHIMESSIAAFEKTTRILDAYENMIGHLEKAATYYKIDTPEYNNTLDFIDQIRISYLRVLKNAIPKKPVPQ